MSAGVLVVSVIVYDSGYCPLIVAGLLMSWVRSGVNHCILISLNTSSYVCVLCVCVQQIASTGGVEIKETSVRESCSLKAQQGKSLLEF